MVTFLQDAKPTQRYSTINTLSISTNQVADGVESSSRAQQFSTDSTFDIQGNDLEAADGYL